VDLVVGIQIQILPFVHPIAVIQNQYLVEACLQFVVLLAVVVLLLVAVVVLHPVVVHLLALVVRHLVHLENLVL
jgi:hypothetical protein